jgi:hypothetical protein
MNNPGLTSTEGGIIMNPEIIIHPKLQHIGLTPPSANARLVQDGARHATGA